LKFFWNIVIALQAMAARKDGRSTHESIRVNRSDNLADQQKKGFSILLQDEKTRGAT